MTERDRKPPHESDFEYKRAVLADPPLWRTLEEMQECNHLLTCQPLTRAEAEEYVKGFDGKIGPFLNTHVSVTGEISFSEIRTHNSHVEVIPLSTEHCYDDKLYFGGAIAVQQEKDAVSPSEKATYSIQLVFARYVKDEENPDQYIQQRGLANPEKVSSIYSESYMSPKRAHALLADRFPDDLKRLEQRLIRGETDVQLLMNLADMVVVTDDLPDDEARYLRQALEEYTHTFIELDMQCPYFVAIRGEGMAKACEQEAYTFGEIIAEGIAYIKKCSWRTYRVVGADGSTSIRLVPHAEMWFLGPTVNTASHEAIMPISTFQKIESLRERFYAPDEAPEDSSTST